MRFASRSKRENLPKGLGEAVNRLLCKGPGNPSPTKRIDTEFSDEFPISRFVGKPCRRRELVYHNRQKRKIPEKKPVNLLLSLLKRQFSNQKTLTLIPECVTIRLHCGALGFRIAHSIIGDRCK